MRQILMNGSVSSLLPELNQFTEQINNIKTMVLNGSCRKCQENSRMAPIIKQAQSYIVGMPKDRVEAFKKSLGVSGKLYAYAPSQNGKPGLVEIG